MKLCWKNLFEISDMKVKDTLYYCCHISLPLYLLLLNVYKIGDMILDRQEFG